MTDISRLPKQLREEGLFCVRHGKVPYNPCTGNKARPNDPGTFAALSFAEERLSEFDGIGVGIFGNICAIDIDLCVDTDGKQSEMCADIISTMASYTEYSPSGSGIRILFSAPGFVYDKAKYYINNQKRGLEVYVAGATQKYVTVTGNTLTPGADMEKRASQLQIILDKYMLRERPKQESCAPSCTTLEDSELIAKAHAAKNGALFGRLWNGDAGGHKSDSEADLALCNLLAFWTGRDAAQMDRLFRASGLMREKWDRPQSGSTYGAITIQGAVQDCGSVYSPQAYFKEKAKKEAPGLAEMRPEANKRYGWGDIGNGNLFADYYKDVARYVPERKKWFIYSGKVWEADESDLKIMELCKTLADKLMNHALSLEDEKLKQEYMKHVGKWQRRNYRETVLRDAAGVHPVQFSTFDKDPFLFNCANGTLNLKTGDFYAHTARNMLTKLSGVRYDPQAKSERWVRFIDEVMEGDKEKAAFLQKALGYALTGDTRHLCPVCGNIEKFVPEKCSICGVPGSKFIKY